MKTILSCSVPWPFLLVLSLGLQSACNGGGGGEEDIAAEDAAPGDPARDDAGGDDGAPTDPGWDEGADPLPDPASDDLAADEVQPPPRGCSPLPDPAGPIVDVTPGQAGELRSIVESAASGTTIRLADGTYMMDGGDTSHRLIFSTPGVTLRSASAARDAVLLDGGYVTTEIISIYASNVTIADISVARAYNHPIHISGSDAGDIEGILIHNVHLIDPGQQAVKINPSYALTYADRGTIECSLIELTDGGRPQIRDSCYTGGIDAHAAWDWVIRLNEIRGFWCLAGLSEHGIHMWRTCRGTLVDSNVIVDCARGVGFGMGESGTADDRVYPDDPYPGAGYLGHIDGVIRNNFITSGISGFDAGITLEQARGTLVAHNTVVSPSPPFSSIEWRWDNTQVRIVSNLMSHNLNDRGGAADLETNIENADPAWFVDPASADLHLTDGAAAAIDAGTPLEAGLCDYDIDGEARGSSPDIGADEHM